MYVGEDDNVRFVPVSSIFPQFAFIDDDSRV